MLECNSVTCASHKTWVRNLSQYISHRSRCQNRFLYTQHPSLPPTVGVQISRKRTRSPKATHFHFSLGFQKDEVRVHNIWPVTDKHELGQTPQPHNEHPTVGSQHCQCLHFSFLSQSCLVSVAEQISPATLTASDISPTRKCLEVSVLGEMRTSFLLSLLVLSSSELIISILLRTISVITWRLSLCPVVRVRASLFSPAL